MSDLRGPKTGRVRVASMRNLLGRPRVAAFWLASTTLVRSDWIAFLACDRSVAGAMGAAETF
jgi:hypothetical protein